LTIKTKSAGLPDFKLPSEYNHLKNQNKFLNYLAASLVKGTIPHALLFTGIKGVGKQSAAQLFSMVCNCADVASQVSNIWKSSDQASFLEEITGPCGQCRSCRKILKGIHPDVILIRPAGSVIKIDQIRALCQKLALKPYESRFRFAILIEADSMNPEAGNALLKMLEEPPERTTLILTAEQASNLLPTIGSRCLHIRLKQIPEKDLAVLLQETHGMDNDKATAIARISGGSFSKAVSLYKQDWISRRDRLIREFISLRSKPAGVAISLAEKLAAKKELLPDCLDILMTWLRDLLVYRYSPNRIIYHDLKDKIQEECGKLNTETTIAGIEAVQEALKRIESNANARLTLEIMILQMTGK
jgi:DNA polymerase-3 subunit delta'